MTLWKNEKGRLRPGVFPFLLGLCDGWGEDSCFRRKADSAKGVFIDEQAEEIEKAKDIWSVRIRGDTVVHVDPSLGLGFDLPGAPAIERVYVLRRRAHVERHPFSYRLDWILVRDDGAIGLVDSEEG